jgi:outer membrane protein assembly factor BamD
MIQRTIAVSVITSGLFCILLGSADAQVSGRKATTKQTDVVLFEQAQTALIRSNFAEARTLLTNLIDSYPDSSYVASAKFFIADSWYAEHAFKQAELEYRDFITFFPNRPEVAEAQRRINSIHRNTASE